MKTYLATALLLCSLFCFNVSATAEEAAPAFKLAGTYTESLNVSDYLVSEKFDGVRAWWDGTALYTRSGRRVNAPGWFTEGFGKEPLDGELWIARGRFDDVSSVVRQASAAAEKWREVSYRVFDLPAEDAPFSTRYVKLKQRVASANAPYLFLVRQAPIVSQDSLMRQLDDIVAAGGEGLMLQHKQAPYRGKRSNDLVKLKPWQDAEAIVLAHLPGEGKFSGLTGALLVETSEGVQFRIGSGMSNQLRANPPPIGSTITYKYSGLSKYGKPRFASFLRMRHVE